MSLPSPNLDDRTWEQIVEEAKKIIPGYCPEWTDFNPSDPGMTLVELMAWMMEMILYRLNRVPDKNYIKFMELLGIRLKSPQPAFTWLVFDPAEGADEAAMATVKQNTHVSGFDSNGNTVTFETLEPMDMTAARFKALFARMDEKYRDCTGVLQPPNRTPEELFAADRFTPHALFMADPDLARAGANYYFCITTKQENSPQPLHTQWSYWNGETWQHVAPVNDGTSGFSKSGDIIFDAFPGIAELQFQGHTGYWLKVELVSYTGRSTPRFETYKKYLKLKREAGILPESGFFSSLDIPFLPVMFEGKIMPFGAQGRTGDTLYLGSRVFKDKGEPLTLHIQLAATYKPSTAMELGNLQVFWEYYSKSGEWQTLGISSPQGTLESKWSFLDRTEAFTKSAALTFRVPADIAALEMGGELQYWIRTSIRRGNYGEKKKLNPPVLDHILIQYKDTARPFTGLISYNDFAYRDLTGLKDLKEDSGEMAAPFVPVNRENPELFMAFDRAFSNKLHHMYFPLHGHYSEDVVVRWEYFRGDKWRTLSLARDGTHNFTRAGLVKLMGPPGWTAHSLFGIEAYWLRVIWLKGFQDNLPYIKNIHLNTVPAANAVSHLDKILGSGNGQPFQRFRFNDFPILPGPRILVRELVTNIEREIEDFKESAGMETVEEELPGDEKNKALWVLWQERENFFHSGRDDRHYILDVHKGIVTFGDGIKGRIPPIGDQNIKCQIYYTGGGSGGNMGSETVTQLVESIPYIDRVSNPYAAAGGTGAETLDEAKLRTPWELKHRNRAVTREDFEQFALQASGEVARVHVAADNDGVIHIMVVPHSEPGDRGKPTLSDGLRDKVGDYLDRHRLITTRIEVFGPSYTDFSVHAEVVLLPTASHLAQQKRTEILEAIRSFFHPLSGDMNGEGWQMGRAVHISELYYIIEHTEGVDYVSKLMLNNLPRANKVVLQPYKFPYAKDIEITFVTG